LGGEEVSANEVVMSIRLGGPEGPGEGGMTPIGGRPIQEIVPLPEARRPQWIQPPTPVPPEMVIPTAEARRRPEPETDVGTTPDEARGRQLTKGSELREGTAMAETGTEGIGLGLSTGGLGGTGGQISLGDFCCPEYLATMIELIRRRWDPNQQVPGQVVIRFTIRRNGAIEDVGVQRSSRYVALDLSAQRAVLLTRQLPPLPSAFTEDSLTVRLTFEYRR
jgi:TonB family protein